MNFWLSSFSPLITNLLSTSIKPLLLHALWTEMSHVNSIAMPNQRASFMCLPSEVRVKIYRLLLCTSKADGTVHHGPPAYRNIFPEILYTSRKIYHEAKHVLYGENIFIRVVHNSTDFELMMNSLGVLSLASPANSKSFSGHSFNVWIAFKIWPPRHPCHMIIESKDIDKFRAVLWIFSATDVIIVHSSCDEVNTVLEEPLTKKKEKVFRRPLLEQWQPSDVAAGSDPHVDLPFGLKTGHDDWGPMSTEEFVQQMQKYRKWGEMSLQGRQYLESAALFAKMFYLGRPVSQDPVATLGHPPSNGTLDPHSLWCKVALETFYASSGFSLALSKLGQKPRALPLIYNAVDIAMKHSALLPISDKDIKLLGKRRLIAEGEECEDTEDDASDSSDSTD